MKMKDKFSKGAGKVIEKSKPTKRKKKKTMQKDLKLINRKKKKDLKFRV